MPSIETKIGRNVLTDNDGFPRPGHFDDEPENSGEETQARLRRLAREVISGIEEIDASRSKELLAAFVVELVYLGKEQEHRAKRRRKQAEAIAAAKAKGVRFGPRPRALPDNFEEMRRAWRSGQVSLKLAAETCGIPKSTFHDAVLRVETAAREQAEAEPARREQHCRKPAETAAAQGPRFGPKPRALPEGFEELRQAWRRKDISLRIAAEACGLPQSTFYSAAIRAETAARAEEAG